MTKTSCFLTFIFASFTVFVNAKIHSVPLTNTQDGHLEIQAVINGVSAKFILDTGATGTVIDTKQLDQFGIKLAQEPISGVGPGGQEQGQIETFPINIDSFSIAGKQINIATIYSNHTSEKLGDEFAGLIGHDALVELQALVDLKNSQLLIPESQNDLNELVKQTSNPYDTLTLQKSAMGFSFVDIELNDQPARLLVDSGASETVLDQSVLAQLNFEMHPHPTAKSIIGEGVELPMKVLKKGRISIGEIVLPNDYLVSDFTALMNAINHQQQRLFVGILGNKQMLEMNTLIDVYNGKLYIRR